MMPPISNPAGPWLRDGRFMLGYGDKNPESLFQTEKLGATPNKDYK